MSCIYCTYIVFFSIFACILCCFLSNSHIIKNENIIFILTDINSFFWFLFKFKKCRQRKVFQTRLLNRIIVSKVVRILRVNHIHLPQGMYKNWVENNRIYFEIPHSFILGLLEVIQQRIQNWKIQTYKSLFKNNNLMLC